MDHKPGEAPAAAVGVRDRDLDPKPGLVIRDLVAGRRAAVTEHRPLTAGKHRGRPKPVPVKRRMSDRVDAGMDRDQASPTASPSDLAGADAGGEELPARDDAVLSLRDLPKHRLDWVRSRTE